ncbi:MAG: hypothetical protein U9Q81_02125 [Pseudomonadota bacterium]|nr:hypothetical protein [Pseudomonadota bacterium]
MMHGHEFGGDSLHLIPGYGHGLFGLLVWALVIIALAVLIGSLFKKKD